MPSFLDIVSITGIIIVASLLLFVAQTLIAPRLVSGTLSEAVPLPCNEGKQWVLYDCKPNSLTRLGCIIPHSSGQYITYKKVALYNASCLPQSNGQESGERVISFIWQEQGTAGRCSTLPTNPNCCEYNSGCTRQATYLCVRTDAPLGGESQCTPEYLPIPYPQFNPHDNNYTVTPIVLQIPCRENYCKTV